VTEKTEVESALVWSNENHSLAETDASLRWHFSGDAEVGSFTAVEKVTTARSHAGDSLGVGFFGNAPCLVGAETPVMMS